MTYVTILLFIYFMIIIFFTFIDFLFKIIVILFVLKFDHNELIHFIRFNRKLLL